MLGLEVEDLINPAEKLAPFITPHVIEAVARARMPDRLRVCKVDTLLGNHSGRVQRPECPAGMKGVFRPARQVMFRARALI